MTRSIAGGLSAVRPISKLYQYLPFFLFFLSFSWSTSSDFLPTSTLHKSTDRSNVENVQSDTGKYNS